MIPPILFKVVPCDRITNPADQFIMRGRKAPGRRGQTLVEYAMILALVVVVCIAMLIQLRSNVGSLYSTINSQVSQVNSPSGGGSSTH